MAPWSPVFVQVRAGYPTYPTRCQHEGDGKRAGQSTKSLKSPIAPCHCIHVGVPETSPPIHTYISFPTRDIVTYVGYRSEEHTSELQSRGHLVCRLLLEKKNMRKFIQL